MNRKITLIALAVASVPMAAMAQTMDSTKTTTRTVSSWEEKGQDRIFDPTLGIIGDVGVSDYNLDLNNEIDAGVGYGLLVDLSPSRNIGLEVGYRGAVNDLNDNISSDGRIVTNQLGGNVKLNLVPPSYDLPGGLRPFIFGGAFWHRVDTDNFTPGIRDDSNLFALPVGAGVEAALGRGFLLGARFTYNFLFDEQSTFAGRDTDMWTASVNIGARIGG